MKLYQVVSRQPDNPAAGFGALVSDFYGSRNAFLKAMAAKGLAHVGEGQAPLREELRGEPRLIGPDAPYGPMWGGVWKDGRVIVRYESEAAYDLLSR